MDDDVIMEIEYDVVVESDYMCIVNFVHRNQQYSAEIVDDGKERWFCVCDGAGRRAYKTLLFPEIKIRLAALIRLVNKWKSGKERFKR